MNKVEDMRLGSGLWNTLLLRTAYQIQADQTVYPKGYTIAPGPLNLDEFLEYVKREMITELERKDKEGKLPKEWFE